ncbi:cyclin-dependent kinase regulatory subunit-domain-containing protein [Ochromonadaceae sp. CCMP2298]|nr:cyclin-dependent kinase regulatory subunit-domain-containing protein [Ochromonadaceae sp. CCMP2298]
MSKIDYSEKYQDALYEYRHVIIPKDQAKQLPKNRTLTDAEWRNIGIQQSRGWEHYAIHKPEPHIILFRRPLGTDPLTGRVDTELERQAKEQYQQELLTSQRG